RDFHVTGVQTCALPISDRGADAAQDAFVNALRGLDAFRGESSFRTWLLRIAANAARTMMRRSERRRETPLELAEPALADGAADPDRKSVVQGKSVERGG